LDFTSVLPFSLILFGFCEPLFYQINLPRRCGDAFCGLHLKYVQNIDGILNAPYKRRATHCRGAKLQFRARWRRQSLYVVWRRIGLAFSGGEQSMSNVDPDRTRKRT